VGGAGGNGTEEGRSAAVQVSQPVAWVPSYGSAGVWTQEPGVDSSKRRWQSSNHQQKELSVR